VQMRGGVLISALTTRFALAVRSAHGPYRNVTASHYAQGKVCQLGKIERFDGAEAARLQETRHDLGGRQLKSWQGVFVQVAFQGELTQ
jgi:hypothetical protein